MRMSQARCRPGSRRCWPGWRSSGCLEHRLLLLQQLWLGLLLDQLKLLLLQQILKQLLLLLLQQMLQWRLLGLGQRLLQLIKLELLRMLRVLRLLQMVLRLLKRMFGWLPPRMLQQLLLKLIMVASVMGRRERIRQRRLIKRRRRLRLTLLRTKEGLNPVGL